MIEQPRYPHCDSLVLHSPGECVYCDDHPEAQQERIDQGINFTGQFEEDKEMCPAWKARGANSQKWAGNTPMSQDAYDSVRLQVDIYKAFDSGEDVEFDIISGERLDKEKE